MTSASELIPFLTDSRIPPYQRVLALAWPAFLQQMLILLIHLSDRWLAGRASPEDQEAQLATQAAQTTGFYLAWFVNCYGALVSVGSTALVARFVGGHDKLSANRVLHQSAWLAVIFGIFGAVSGFMGLGQLIHLLQLDGPSADFAKAYLQPVVVLLPFQLLESALIACLVGAGDTRTGFWVLGGLTLVNLPLAWSFFHGWGPFPEMGFAGISLGTSVGHLFAALLLIAILLRGRAGLRLQSQFAAPDWGFWWRILRISVPAAADTLSIALGQLVVLSLVN
ncbi:MAG: MATE family efflux transporter, partial [Gemmataceae bacterium]